MTTRRDRRRPPRPGRADSPADDRAASSGAAPSALAGLPAAAPALAHAAAQPVVSLWRLLWQATVNFFADDGFDRAAAISCYALLSSLPFFGLAALFSGWLIGSHDWILRELLFGIGHIMPNGGEDVAEQARIEIGRQGAVLLVLSPVLLWSASNAAAAVEASINHILRLREHRRFLVARLKSVALLGAGAICLLAIPALQHLAVIAREISPDALRPVHSFAEKPMTEGATFLAAFLTFTVTLLMVPAVPLPRKKTLAVAAGAALVWQICRLLIGRALGIAAGPSVVTSSFSFVVATVMWVYVTATILLFAAELLALVTGRRPAPEASSPGPARRA